MRYVFLCLTLLLFLCSCSKSVKSVDRREEKDPVMVEAQRKEGSGELESAIALYKDIIEKDPRIAKAHLDIAVLLHDHKRRSEDYAHAIYHYRRYLELRPETEKSEMINGRVEAALLSLAEDYGQGRSKKLYQEIARARMELDKRAGVITDLEAENEELKKKIGEIERKTNRR